MIIHLIHASMSNPGGSCNAYSLILSIEGAGFFLQTKASESVTVWIVLHNIKCSLITITFPQHAHKFLELFINLYPIRQLYQLYQGSNEGWQLTQVTGLLDYKTTTTNIKDTILSLVNATLYAYISPKSIKGGNWKEQNVKIWVLINHSSLCVKIL